MIEIYSDANELALAAAEYFVAQCPETVALSGGSTPKLMFQVLAEQFRDEVSWDKVQFFWSDERHVPPDNPESNYRMANEALKTRGERAARTRCSGSARSTRLLRAWPRLACRAAGDNRRSSTCARR